jgi:hypothetical protein
VSEKRPQPTEVLVKRLRRVAKWIDWCGSICSGPDKPQWLARANTCWQAAARLEELGTEDHVKNVLFEATIKAGGGPPEGVTP